MNPMLPDDPDSKLNVCVRNVLKIREEGKDQKLTQLLFCDLSTPKNDGNFNVYDDIRKKLIAAGVPENEIEFIHNADTEAKKGSTVLESALRRCARPAGQHRKDGCRNQCAAASCCSASSGCRLETQRHDPAQRSHHPAGKPEPGSQSVQLRYGGYVRFVFVRATRSRLIQLSGNDQTCYSISSSLLSTKQLVTAVRKRDRTRVAPPERVQAETARRKAIDCKQRCDLGA